MAVQSRFSFPTPEEIPEQWQFPTPLEQRSYLINGEIHHWDGPMHPVDSPVYLRKEDRLEKVRLGSYPLMTGVEALQALESACNAYDKGRGAWPTLSVEDRIRHIEEFTLKMRQQRTEVVRLLMWEVGKTLKDSEKEFDRTVDYIHDTVEALKELDRRSSSFTLEQQILGQIRRSPLGVVLCMGPFNYPLNETFTTLIPALIMGNTVIFKPPKLGVLLHEPLLKAFQEAFPPGVVNTVYGDGPSVINPLMESGRIDVLAFIGSSRVADLLKKAHPKPHRMRGILGLEAKNPAIILPDADLDLTVKETLLGSLSFNGQRCTALKLIFVHRSIADRYINSFCNALDQLKAGMPWESGVNLTPLPEPEKTTWLQSLVQDAANQGAQVVNPGGGAISRSFFWPAVLYPVAPSMQAYQLEQFGPIVPIVPYDHIDEPLDYVATSDYGQQISLFGKNPDQMAALIDPLVNQVCRVNLNSQCQRGPDTFPFTGRKDSAEGTLSVSDALRCFSIRSLVAAKNEEVNQELINNIVRERKSRFLSTDFIF